jgi:hypothetical protein
MKEVLFYILKRLYNNFSSFNNICSEGYSFFSGTNQVSKDELSTR